ncbi:efflux RND transporter periplasmic adaptor subunit [Fusibacter paucivorans]|uniref:Efflux RND transporter periplasmic adaptor subunit n=1 Tax=Fusibacter paucivorans TaxID=76009 RepID=A0ABS5PQU4_9FIRM|nr:efflux RND transporter periplasmic adaptor subunit [Fusibacter paucivorans]MBS7527441.1 efflux RND transporter periplasmic adaptor subunit [Fusibacter paucivorans]
MKRHKIWLSCIGLSLLLLAGCGRESASEDVSRVKTVETQAVATSITEEQMVYYGYVESGSMTKLSFKSAGVLEALYVEKGDYVEKGEALAALDDSDYNIQLLAAQAGVQSIYATLNKATQAYNDAKSDYEDYEKLFAAGSISQAALEKAKLNFNVSEQDLNAAREGYQQAQHNLEALSKSVNELKMTASIEGVVVETLYEANEAVAAGYPVIVIRSEDSVFKASVAQRDLKHLSIGQPVTMRFTSETYEGEITAIGNTPDTATHTYEIEVSINGDVPLGSVGEGTFVIDSYKGIKIPMEAVIKGDTDYVYTIRDGIAVKQSISIEKRIKNELIVSGLQDGDQLVVKGFNRLNDGDHVNILNEEAK